MSAPIPPEAAVIIIKAFLRSNADKSVTDLLSYFPAPQPSAERVRQWTRNLVTAGVLGQTDTPSGRMFWATESAPNYLQQAEQQIAKAAGSPAVGDAEKKATDTTSAAAPEIVSLQNQNLAANAAGIPPQGGVDAKDNRAPQETLSGQSRGTDSGTLAPAPAQNSAQTPAEQSNTPAPTLASTSDAPTTPVSGQASIANAQPTPPQNQQPSAAQPTSLSSPSAHGQTQAPRPDGVDATAAEIGALLAKVLSPEALAKASVGNARNGWKDVARRMLPDVIDRFVPAGQPAWLRTLILLTAGALVILVLYLTGDVVTFAMTHKWTSFSALSLVLVGAILFARRLGAQPSRFRQSDGRENDASRATEIGAKSAELRAEIGSPRATEIRRPSATASASQEGAIGTENRASKRRWSKYYLLIGVNLGIIVFAVWRAWSWYSNPRPSPAEIPAEKAAARAPAAAAKPSSAVSNFLRPGTLFSGTATEPGRADSYFVLIEIVAASAGSPSVSAVLRNDGGWTDARAFQGEWIVGPDGVGKLTLQTQNSDRIPGAGPMLNDPGASSLVLQFRADGSAIVSPGNWTIRRLDPAAAATIKTNLNRAVETALAATKSGMIYRGTATSRKAALAEPISLRFLDQNSDGSLLLATLEPAGKSGGIRTFHGTIVGNSYRAGSTPIRLRSSDNERVPSADPNSLLGLNSHNDSLVLALRVTGSHLVGDDDRFTYDFARVDDANLVSDHAGSARESDSGNRIPETGKGEPQPPENRDPSTTQIVVRAPSPVAQNGEPVTGGERASSPVASHANQTGGDARSPSGSDHPTISTPPAESAESIRNPQSEIHNSTPPSAFPNSPSDFPSAPGAYVLADGAWVRLPANHGHNVQSTAQVVAMKFAQLNQAEDKWAGKTPAIPNDPVADLLFDGFDQVPVVPAKNVVVIFVGSLPPPPPDAVKKYPQLGTYPLLELAPETFLANGNRYALLYLIAPGYIGFGPKRVEATLETPKPGVTLLRCSAELPPGRYAFSCGAQSFEVGVK